MTVLDRCSKQLDMEESVCEKMRSKYEGEWTQQPSSRLTSTLRGNIRNYRRHWTKRRGAMGNCMRNSDKMRLISNRCDKRPSSVRLMLFSNAVRKIRAKSSSSNSPGY